MKYIVKVASDGIIYISSFMKSDWGIQVIFKLLSRHYLNNFRDCSVGSTD
jgi:hypothetical protein